MNPPWWRRVLCWFGMCSGHVVSRPNESYGHPVFLCNYCGRVER